MSGTYECFHCCHRTVVWDSDFSFEDMGYEGEGLVHICHCTHCGAEIEYRISEKTEDEEDGRDDGQSNGTDDGKPDGGNDGKSDGTECS